MADPVLDQRSPNLVVIPARCGSKRIPGKNLLEVGGKPLLWWTVEALRRSRNSFRVVVSSDCRETLDYVDSLGCEGLKRDSDLSHDEATTELVMADVMDRLDPRIAPSMLMLLQCTSPVRLPGCIDQALAEYEASGRRSLVSVCRAPFFLWMGSENAAKANYDLSSRPRTQVIDGRVFAETGSVYITSPVEFARQFTRVGSESKMFVRPWIESLDIDDGDDLHLLDGILRSLKEAWNV